MQCKKLVIILIDSEAVVVWIKMIKLFWFYELISVNVNVNVTARVMESETMSPCNKVMPSIQFLST